MRTITIQDVLEQFDNLDLDAANPLDSCVYTTRNGDHCIAGQILVNLELPLPEVESDNNKLPIRGLVNDVFFFENVQFEDAALALLVELQNLADLHNGNGGAMGHSAWTWERVILEAKIRLELQ